MLKLEFTRGFPICYEQHYELKLTFKASVPTFPSGWKNFSTVMSQLFWWIRSFQSIISGYFGPKTTTFLHSSSSCRKPTKCKLATPEIIRWKPGKSFARAIQILHVLRAFLMLLWDDITRKKKRQEQTNERSAEQATERNKDEKSRWNAEWLIDYTLCKNRFTRTCDRRGGPSCVGRV